MWEKASGTWVDHAGERDIVVPAMVTTLVAALRAGNPGAEKRHRFYRHGAERFRAASLDRDQFPRGVAADRRGSLPLRQRHCTLRAGRQGCRHRGAHVESVRSDMGNDPLSSPGHTARPRD